MSQPSRPPYGPESNPRHARAATERACDIHPNTRHPRPTALTSTCPHSASPRSPTLARDLERVIRQLRVRGDALEELQCLLCRESS
ncbi:hypothetical protein BC628DRAFT_805811 [Trametes gibbosa]|nr:hypothetical protein BC628DRAFT_805811 [Trametes gibbosa]